jgi:GTPase
MGVDNFGKEHIHILNNLEIPIFIAFVAENDM